MIKKSVAALQWRSLLATTALLAVTLGCVSCGMNLRHAATGPASAIAGQWQLQSPPRDELAGKFRTLLERVQAKQAERFRREFARRAEHDASGVDIKVPEPDSSADNDPHAAASQRLKWQVRELHAETEALLNLVLPVNQLSIAQSRQRIEFSPKSGARRSFDMGEASTLVSSHATLRIESGWQENTFVVHSRDAEQGIDIVERYQRKGDQLQLKVEFKAPELRTQNYVASYVRTP